jgi:hypothetical protein
LDKESLASGYFQPFLPSNSALRPEQGSSRKNKRVRHSCNSDVAVERAGQFGPDGPRGGPTPLDGQKERLKYIAKQVVILARGAKAPGLPRPFDPVVLPWRKCHKFLQAGGTTRQAF